LRSIVNSYVVYLLEQPAHQGPESAVERIALNRASWEAELKRFIAQRLHLDVEIIFEIQPSVGSPDVSIRITDLQVSPRDALHTSFPLTGTVVLTRGDFRAAEPLPRSEQDQRTLAGEIVARTFRDRLTLFAYWYQPGQVKNELEKALGEVLVRFGYSLKRLLVDPITPPVASEELISDDIGWSGRLGRPIPFHIETKIMMMPDGAGLFHAKGMPSRRSWIKSQVQDALQAAMYGRDFINLTAEAEKSVHKAVEETLKERARTIGHDVATYVAKAAIPEQSWFGPSPVRVERREYKTKNPLVQAEFEIDLMLQLTSLEPFEPVIQAHRRNRPNDLEDGANDAIRATIAEAAATAAERAMSLIEPARYFAEYEQWDFTNGGGEQRKQENYVRDQLAAAVRTVLQVRFGISICQVDPRRVDQRGAEIITHLQNLGDITVVPEIEPDKSLGSDENVKIHITYHISGVVLSEWANVIQRGKAALTLELLSKDLLAASHTALSNRTPEELRRFASRFPSDVRDEVQEFVAGKLSLYRGVMVGIKSAFLESSEADKIDRRIAAVPTAQKRAAMQRADRIIAEAASEGDDEAHRKYLRSRRERVQSLINSNPRETDEDFEKLDRHQKELKDINKELVDERRVIQDPLSNLRLAGPAGRSDREGPEKPEEPKTTSGSEPRDSSL